MINDEEGDSMAELPDRMEKLERIRMLIGECAQQGCSQNGSMNVVRQI